MKHLALFLFCSFLISCSSLSSKNQPIVEISRYLDPSTTAYKKLEDPYHSSYGELPSESHKKVDFWVRYFTKGKGRNLMKRYLERSSRYFPMMKGAMRDEELPDDLVYVALIESGFSSQAHSRANAVGYWQFIKGTGRRYGLRINHFVDERKDPVLSTRAAAKYFKDLYSLFGSWHLALAAYNAGEYRVNRVVLRHYNRNFWHLISKKSLPSETRNYIPKFIAAKEIGKNPKKYGFSELNYQEPFEYEVVNVQKSISLRKLSNNLKLSYKEIRRMNPMYKGEFVPVYGNAVTVRVPKGMRSIAIASLGKSLMKQPRYAYLDHFWYRVRRGDTLSHIARRNRTTISSIRRNNRLGRSNFIRIGQKLKIPTRKLATVSLRKKKATPYFYKVRRGDTLSRISRKYGVRLSQLRKMNRVRGNTINIGQNLRLRPGTSQRQLASAKKQAGKSKYYVVRSGDTLIGIAKKYNITLPKLMKANSLNFQSILLTGTRLVIP